MNKLEGMLVCDTLLLARLLQRAGVSLPWHLMRVPASRDDVRQLILSLLESGARQLIPNATFSQRTQRCIQLTLETPTLALAMRDPNYSRAIWQELRALRWGIAGNPNARNSWRIAAIKPVVTADGAAIITVAADVQGELWYEAGFRLVAGWQYLTALPDALRRLEETWSARISPAERARLEHLPPPSRESESRSRTRYRR